jgi:hypothetical protein
VRIRVYRKKRSHRQKRIARCSPFGNENIIRYNRIIILNCICVFDNVALPFSVYMRLLQVAVKTFEYVYRYVPRESTSIVPCPIISGHSTTMYNIMYLAISCKYKLCIVYTYIYIYDIRNSELGRYAS